MSTVQDQAKKEVAVRYHLRENMHTDHKIYVKNDGPNKQDIDIYIDKGYKGGLTIYAKRSDLPDESRYSDDGCWLMIATFTLEGQLKLHGGCLARLTNLLINEDGCISITEE